MTPTPEVIAFRARIDAEGQDWPPELKAAAVWLRCELDGTRKKGWQETGGPARLAEAFDWFARLYAARRKRYGD